MPTDIKDAIWCSSPRLLTKAREGEEYMFISMDGPTGNQTHSQLSFYTCGFKGKD